MSSLAAAVAAAASKWASSLSRILSSSTPTANPPRCNPKTKRARTPTSKPPAADADSIADLGAQAAARTESDADHKLPKPLGGIIKAIVRERDPDKLVSKFVEASSASSHFRDRHRAYEVAVSRLTSLGRQDGIEAIIEAQKPFLKTSTEGFATRLIRLYGGASMPSHAAATFHQLPARHKSTRTFNAVLAAYAQAGDLDALTAAFKEIPATHPSIVPSVYSYNVLIRTLCQKSDLSAALDAVLLMEKRGVLPDIITFNSLLNGYLNCDRNDEAETVWGMIKERNLELDVKCYNARLRGLIAQGRIDDAAAVLEMLEKDGPKPNIGSYNELIRGYCKAGRFQEANKVYDNLMKNECVPNKDTYETLLPYLLQAGELDCALRYCYEIVGSKRCCGVEYGVLQNVVHALLDESRLEEANKLVELRWKNYNSRKSLRMPPSAEMMRKNQYQMKRSVKVEDETEK